MKKIIALLSIILATANSVKAENLDLTYRPPTLQSTPMPIARILSEKEIEDQLNQKRTEAIHSTLKSLVLFGLSSYGAYGFFKENKENPFGYVCLILSVGSAIGFYVNVKDIFNKNNIDDIVTYNEYKKKYNEVAKKFNEELEILKKKEEERILLEKAKQKKLEEDYAQKRKGYDNIKKLIALLKSLANNRISTNSKISIDSEINSLNSMFIQGPNMVKDDFYSKIDSESKKVDQLSNIVLLEIKNIEKEKEKLDKIISKYDIYKCLDEEKKIDINKLKLEFENGILKADFSVYNNILKNYNKYIFNLESLANEKLKPVYEMEKFLKGKKHKLTDDQFSAYKRKIDNFKYRLCSDFSGFNQIKSSIESTVKENALTFWVIKNTRDEPCKKVYLRQIINMGDGRWSIEYKIKNYDKFCHPEKTTFKTYVIKYDPENEEWYSVMEKESATGGKTEVDEFIDMFKELNKLKKEMFE